MKLTDFLIVTITVSCFMHAAPLTSEASGPKALPEMGSPISSDTNVHYSGRYCEQCHNAIPAKGVDPALKFNGDFSQLCRCHTSTITSYTHPVNIIPSEEKQSKMPQDFPLKNGELACSTCHDMYLQCQYSQFLPENRNFLRGGPYARRTDICFRCHNENQYTQLNPHAQLNASGLIISEQCLYCHPEKPDENNATFENIKLIGDMKTLCQRCHNIKDRHPAGQDHFTIPDNKILTMMKSAEIIYGAIFPLDGEGKITCVTCHNPHERGVIPEAKEGARGASLKYRLASNMCSACHDI